MSEADSSGGPEAGKALVGYGRPPVAHRFKKGISGNPRGRPKKIKSSSRPSASTPLDDIILAEAMRPIQVRENDKVTEMPMVQALIRSMGVSAVKGHHRSQLSLAGMIKAVQDRRFEDLKQLFISAIEYKDSWQRAFDECDARGVPRPEPVPHPDEIVLDSSAMQVRFNGPVGPDDKARWDQLLERRREALDSIKESREEMKRSKKYRDFYQSDIDHEQSLADMIGGMIPDETTRRQAGFDIDEWREHKGVLAKLKEKRRRQEKSAR